MINQKSDRLTENTENQALIYLQQILDNEGLELNKDFQLSQAVIEQDQNNLPEEFNYDCDNLKQTVNNSYPKLNTHTKIK